MVRIGNENQHSMVEAEFRIMFSCYEPLVEGGNFRYFYVLKLHFDRLTVFPAALTLRHTIDGSSAFWCDCRVSRSQPCAVFSVSRWNRSGPRSVGSNAKGLHVARY